MRGLRASGAVFMLGGMDPTTRFKLNSLRPPLLGVALHNMANKPGALEPRYIQIAYASGLGEAFIQRRDDRDKARAKNRVARASRKINRQRRKAGLPA